MSTVSYAVTDTATMLRRTLRHMRRYPSLTIMLIGMPIVILLVFVYVFGGAIGNGIGGSGLGGGLAGAGGRGAYVNYVVPGIIGIAVASAVQGTAISVAMDMTEGIMNRFRTMAIYRASVLTGHVIGSMIQTLLSIVVVLGVALAVGFRPNATVVEWIAAIGILALFTLALTWLAVALGMKAKSVETASNTPMFLILLPFLGSGFVPTDSMPAVLRWFAQYQPFTPVMETLRGLLLGGPIGNNAVIAAAWGVLITAFGYVVSKRLFTRDPRP
ncbi:MAG: ABC transporter permease [Actinomycetota bacterium]|nr:ABC transporter permease [Actinomycetota bacterium]